MVDGRDNAWRSRAPGPHAHRTTARQIVDGLKTEARGQQKQSNDPRQQPAHPQYANYWAPLTRNRHTMPHSAQPQHTNYWAPRTRKRHQQEHRPQRPTESSDPTQHAKGRTVTVQGPVKKQQPDGMSHRGGVVGLGWVKASPGRLPTVRAAFPAGPDWAAVPGCPVTRPTGLLTAPRPRGGARGREMPPCLCVCALVCLRGGGGGGRPPKEGGWGGMGFRAGLFVLCDNG